MRKNTVLRFRDKIDTTGDCWLWLSQLDHDGYGLFSYEGRKIGAHQMAWKIEYGRLPPKPLCVLHTCDVRRCVRPAHLYAGTRLDNVKDMVSRNRQHRWDPEQSNGAKLTWEIVRQIRADRLAQYAPSREIGARHHLTDSAVRLILVNKTWVDVAFDPMKLARRKLKPGYVPTGVSRGRKRLYFLPGGNPGAYIRKKLRGE